MQTPLQTHSPPPWIIHVYLISQCLPQRGPQQLSPPLLQEVVLPPSAPHTSYIQYQCTMLKMMMTSYKMTVEGTLDLQILSALTL